jgi:pimeloyl-ACP methyl ester carboxylesterase
MRYAIIIILLIFSFGIVEPQDIDTSILHYAVSKNATIVYKRLIEFDEKKNLYHVKDYFENGQIQMEASYSSFDKHIKEEYQCNYRSNTKEGLYKEWHENGQIEFVGNYKNGLRNGLSTSWYINGQKEAEENWLNGQLHGPAKYWTEEGDLQFDLIFEHGLNQNQKHVDYHYITYLPPDYKPDAVKKWPLIIFLHGGSARGTNTLDLYDYGPFDQIYRGREFQFIIVAPQCPKHIRWSTENWFENFYKDLMAKYKIDANRIYLTGASLGGSGTWYLAIKYPEIFAAIAPMSGFTGHMEYINKYIGRICDLPVWAFHGELDNVVQFEETENLINKLKKINKQVKFTKGPEIGHWIHNLVYPGEELYDWFLQHDKRLKNNN